MKNLLLLSVAMIFSTVIFARTNTTTHVAANPSLKADRKALVSDLKEKKADEKQFTADIKDGNTIATKEHSEKIKAGKIDIKSTVNDLKKDHVKHPRHHACHNMGKKHH